MPRFEVNMCAYWTRVVEADTQEEAEQAGMAMAHTKGVLTLENCDDGIYLCDETVEIKEE